MARGVSTRRCVPGGAAARRAAALALLFAARSLATTAPDPAQLDRQRIEYDADAPKSILELQPFRTGSRAEVRRADGVKGTATLVDLNPYSGYWYLLTLEWTDGTRAQYHLETARPRPATLALGADRTGALVVTPGAGVACSLHAGARGELEAAAASGLPYAPLCDGALYLRNRVTGRRTTIERLTDLLRDHVWGGDRIVNFVKEKLYRDAWLEPETPGGAAALPGPVAGPLPAAVAAPGSAGGISPGSLAIDLATTGRALAPGTWYAVRGLDGVAVSMIAPHDLAADPGTIREPHVNALDPVEAQALVYLIAFDLARFDLHFVLGTDHPRLEWSDRPPPAMRDPRLPGPDGVGGPAPLVTNGLVSPVDAQRTIAAFVGGFKRIHGAFRVGPLALRNHGSHYGFIEEGVIFSKLQPGLATVLVTDDGVVDLATWTAADEPLLPHLRYARQNGVPLIEWDRARARGVPGELVDRWGPGNWSGSAEEALRTVRAGLCLQEGTQGRYLVYAYFSAATPSAMARTFQAYQCRYALHLDMNALEHTYLALYVRRGNDRLVEHLVAGMEAVDRSAGGNFAPRFLAFPDDRDFFYLTRRGGPP